MRLYQCFFTNNDCYKKNVKFRPKGIMWHSTAADNPYIKRYVQPDDGRLGDNRYNNDWNQSGLKKCVHAFIGKLQDGTIATYQTLPFDIRGSHCGQAYAGGPSANDTHLSFEICEDALTDETYFNQVYKEAVEFSAYLCKKFGFDPLKDGVIMDHYEGNERKVASDHGDITHWLKKFGKTMDDVRKDIYNEINGLPLSIEEEEEMRYNTLGDLKRDPNARFYVPTIEKLLAKGVLTGKGGAGDATIIDLGEDSIRLLVVLDRQKIFG